MFNLDKFQMREKAKNQAQDKDLLKLAIQTHKDYPHLALSDILKELMEMRKKK